MTETLPIATPDDDLVGVEHGNQHAEAQGAIAAGIKLLGEQSLVGVGIKPEVIVDMTAESLGSAGPTSAEDQTAPTAEKDQ